MYRRFLSVLLLLAVGLQGPMLTIAGSLSGDSGAHCYTDMLRLGKVCESCCSHGSMPSCAAQCSISIGAVLPPALPNSLRIAIRSVLIPDAGDILFAEYVPPHPLRPPIV